MWWLRKRLRSCRGPCFGCCDDVGAGVWGGDPSLEDCAGLSCCGVLGMVGAFENDKLDFLENRKREEVREGGPGEVALDGSPSEGGVIAGDA